MNFLYSFVIALSFLTIIPTPTLEWKPERSKYTSLFIPIIGLIIGAIGLLLFWCMLWLHIGNELKGALLMVYFLVITGGLHFDGLIDAADAYFSRRDLPKRLEIMKDSRVGAFGVMAAVVMLILKWAVFIQLFAILDFNSVNSLSDISSISSWTGFLYLPLLVLIPVLSRCFQAAMIYAFPPAKAEGMGNMMGGSLPKSTALLFYVMFIAASALVFVLCGGIYALTIPGVALLFYIFYYFSTKKNFGGVTGDLMGAYVELAELLMWFTAIIVIA